ncbi:hypothetical protein BH11PSE6_BH11PSE6_21020 [soil metagenome]
MTGGRETQRIKPRQITVALVLTALSAAAITLILAMLGPYWSVYAPATCTATRCFCEAPRFGSLVLQPANSWSSLGYVLAGFLMIVLARSRSWHSGMTPPAAIVLGITAIIFGLGSVLLHATLTLWGQFFDVLGMYLVGSFLLVSALARWMRLPDRQAIVLYLLLCVALVAALIAVPEVRRWLFAVVLILAIVVELAVARPRRPGVQVRWYLLGLVTNTVAFLLWNLDQHSYGCMPDSLIQGHAAWHLLGAVALWLTFLYYRSERAG